ncbi:MAG: lamin tail domain-containing protein, partial [Myxococcales bacterium]|nr:lamin tail domain-containing protein [Myxococcales bacterium]
GGGTGGGGVDVNAQIAAIRAEADIADGGTVSLPVNGALVTHLKPAISGATADPPGFFIQGQQAGPAVFVAVDPATLTPATAVGDAVSFTATQVGVASGLRQVTAVSSYTRDSAGNNTTNLAQTVSGVDFTAANAVNEYESELVTLTGSVTAVGTAGTGYDSATMTTTGTTTGTSLRLRIPNSLQATEDIGVGCTVSATAIPLWRFTQGTTNQAQPSAWVASSLAGTTCPAPRVTMAEALNSTTVRVSFNRAIASGSVTPGAFTITGGTGLTVSAAMNSSPTQVVLTTSTQVGATTYTVTVASSVQDVRGTGVDSANNSAMFQAARPNDCTAAVVISQLYPAGGNSGSVQTFDFIELHNRTNAAVNLAGWSLQYQSPTGSGAWSPSAANKYVFDAGTIAAGGYFLVQGAAGTNDAGPLPVAPDLVTSLALGGTAGKVALVGNDVSLTGCPVGAADAGGLVDFVGYGSTANCSENSMPFTGFTNAQALQRNEQSGAQLTCSDTNSNTIDFAPITPAPRNSGSTANVCTCP